MPLIYYTKVGLRSDFIKIEEFQDIFNSVNWIRENRDWKRLYFSVNDFSTTITARNGEGKCIGFISAMTNGLHCYIHTLVVHKDYQGQGIGKRLLKEMISNHANFNIALHTRHVRDFYVKQGFTHSGSNFMELNLTGEGD